MKEGVRKSILAGTWYPGSPDVLRRDVENFLAKASVKAEGQIVGLIAPHAGYVYSGGVAAHAYKLVQGEVFDSVVVVAPSHRARFQGASVYDRGGYETPLGVVPVDTELAGKIMARRDHISFIPGGHAQEHSLEIQLPFLQVSLGSFRFVPIVMGEQGRRFCEDLAGAIAESAAGKKVLLVGSSDLSHFHGYDTAKKMDSRVLKHLEAMDADGLLRDLESGFSEACGGGPMAVVMMAAGGLGADRAQVLKYANSGDVTGDRSGVVGYAAAAFSRSGSDRTKKRHGTGKKESELTDEERSRLLALARETIEDRLQGKKITQGEGAAGVLKEERGVFVSLHKKGKLRGCIGYIEGRKPLLEAVREMAQSAAFEDPRFSPLRREEMKDLDIEISVLTPLKEVSDINEIEVGTHGIYLTRGFFSGLLLPQVATQYGWDRVTFLEETCRKAGLPPQAWKDKKTRIYIFSADIFGEKSNQPH
jgi:AmmeMemoRadiSam system protein B/AmmeMemoRadiSam system protein A